MRLGLACFWNRELVRDRTVQPASFNLQLFGSKAQQLNVMTTAGETRWAEEPPVRFGSSLGDAHPSFTDVNNATWVVRAGSDGQRSLHVVPVSFAHEVHIVLFKQRNPMHNAPLGDFTAG